MRTSERGAAEGAVRLEQKRAGLALSKALRKFVRTKPLGAAGALIILGVIFLALFAPIVATHDPLLIDSSATFTRPGAEHYFGTDNLGRDVFSRIVYGARISLYVGIISVGLGTVTGALIGLLTAYFGGKFDLIVQRFVDVLMAFPSLIFALAIVAMLGQSLLNVVIAISLVLLTGPARVIRSAALSVKQNMYVDAAHAIGCSDARILFRHILPNVVAPFIILATAALGAAILIEASLSFLGVGTPPPAPSWGGMLTGSARTFAEKAPWLGIFPGLAISMAVFGFNLFGDALRDVLDPRLRGR